MNPEDFVVRRKCRSCFDKLSPNDIYERPPKDEYPKEPLALNLSKGERFRCHST